MNKLAILGVAAATLGAVALSVPAQADEAGDNAAVQNRQHLMAGLGGTMGTMGCYMKGNCDLPKPVLQLLAQGMVFNASHGAAAFKDKTPNATVKTEAKDGIWDNWDDFSGHFADLQKAAMQLADAAGDKAAMGEALGAVGKTCKGCHSDYREK
jgi:cytochrome c556